MCACGRMPGSSSSAPIGTTASFRSRIDARELAAAVPAEALCEAQRLGDLVGDEAFRAAREAHARVADEQVRGERRGACLPTTRAVAVARKLRALGQHEAHRTAQTAPARRARRVAGRSIRERPASRSRAGRRRSAAVRRRSRTRAPSRRRRCARAAAPRDRRRASRPASRPGRRSPRRRERPIRSAHRTAARSPATTRSARFRRASRGGSAPRPCVEIGAVRAAVHLAAARTVAVRHEVERPLRLPRHVTAQTAASHRDPPHADAGGLGYGSRPCCSTWTLLGRPRSAAARRPVVPAAPRAQPERALDRRLDRGGAGRPAHAARAHAARARTARVPVRHAVPVVPVGRLAGARRAARAGAGCSRSRSASACCARRWRDGSARRRRTWRGS